MPVKPEKGEGLRMKPDKRQSGSISIEATVALTAYIFVIIAILSIINICRTQMIISVAVDQTAKEMSQYAYFYDISGLDNITSGLDKDGKEAKKNTNQLIDYSKTMMTSLQGMSNGVQQTGSDIQGTYNSLQNSTSFDDALSQVQKAADTIGNNVDNIQNHAETFKKAADAFEAQIKTMDVESYMRSLGAMAAGKGVHAVLSRLICAPIAKCLMTKHLAGYAGDGVSGSDWDKADATLKNLGLTNGMSDLNFLMSEMFSEEEPKQIHLVCYYTVPLSTVIAIPGDKHLVFCKEAVTNAWLSGFKAEQQK